MIPVFDGHNDFVLRLFDVPDKRRETFLTNTGEGHLDLPRMQAAGFAGGFFAVYLPSPRAHDDADYQAQMENPPYALPLPAPIPQAEAIVTATRLVGHLLWMERESQAPCGSAARAPTSAPASPPVPSPRSCTSKAPKPSTKTLTALHLFHALGLRSLGPVWSRPTAFGHGVPFAFPSSPDTGPGLTEAGKRLVRACNALKIMLDLSHMNEAGFNDVAALSDAPLVATHSNAHAVTPSSRNLTDRQLHMIRDTAAWSA